MKTAAWLLFFAPPLIGCGTTAWEDTGEVGPWCATGRQARVLSRTVNPIGAPNPQTQLAFEDGLGRKQEEGSLWRKLDEYFSQCTFIQEWPTRGTINSVAQHEAPFDFYMISINPIVIMGVDRQPLQSVPPKLSRRKCEVFVGSKHLVGFIAVRTKIPYRPGLHVVWFSPDADHELHELDLKDGIAGFTVGEKVRVTVTVEDNSQLVTSRE